MQITRSSVQQHDETRSPVTSGEHVSDEHYAGGRSA